MIMEEVPGMYRVSSDHLKWEISGYDRHTHRDLKHRITKGLFETILKEGIPVLLDTLLRSEESYLEFRNLADHYGYEFLTVELTAPQELLVKRFHERVERSEAGAGKISIKTEEDFLLQLARKPHVPKDSPLFDTSKTDAAEITQEILKKLQ